MITGSYPPKVCGVGDYTDKLINELDKELGLKLDLFYKPDWSLKHLFRYLKELILKRSSFYHLQYPTEGYGYSFLPLILFFFLPVNKRIVTVHELSNRNLAAYIYTGILIFLSSETIVSNELEKNHAFRFTFRKNKIKVIPIASNISASPNSNRPIHERQIDLAYFGHIRPLKGIEEFIDSKRLLTKRINCKIIGQSLENYKDFFQEVLIQSAAYEIDVIANASETQVQELLADTKILYLPYPDGISNRRGTLLAGIQNECIIISKTSKFENFNIFFTEHCYLVSSNADAAEIIDNLLSKNQNYKTTKKLKDIFSWKNVTVLHRIVYGQK